MEIVNAYNLLNTAFISEYFAKKIINPQYKNIEWKDINITPIKRGIGETYHLVVRYDVPGLNQPIFCTAHSKEGREHAYRALEYIDDHAFFRGKLISLIPLFYDSRFKAMFYLGVDGKNLLDYIKKGEERVEPILKLTAAWLAELHSIKADPRKHTFNPLSVYIETMAPGSHTYLGRIKRMRPDYFSRLERIFIELDEFDRRNLEKNRKWLIHGDVHPENVVINEQDETEITIIDYTDVCVADYARDLGNFLQQLEYMVERFNSNLATRVHELQKLFLNEYLKKRNVVLDDSLKKRISMYMAWTAFRSIVFFLTKGFVERKEADKLIKRIHYYLNAASNNTLIFQ